MFDFLVMEKRMYLIDELFDMFEENIKEFRKILESVKWFKKKLFKYDFKFFDMIELNLLDKDIVLSYLKVKLNFNICVGFIFYNENLNCLVVEIVFLNLEEVCKYFYENVKWFSE